MNSMKRISIALFLLGFAYMTSCYIVRAALPYLGIAIGASTEWIARVLYVSFIVLALLTPLSGYLCDRLDSTRIATVSTLLTFLSITCYTFVGDVIELLTTRIMHAALGQLLLAASLGIAAELSSISGTGFGTLRFGQGLGIAIGLACGGVVTTFLGPRYAVLLAAFIILIPLPLYLAMWRTRGATTRRSTVTFLKAFREAMIVLRDRLLTSEFILAISENVGFALLLSYYVAYLVSEAGWRPWMYATFLAAESLSFSVGSLASEKLYERYGPLSLVVEGLGLAATYLLLYTYRSWIDAVAIAIPLGILSGFVAIPAFNEASKRARLGRTTVVCVMDTLVSLTITAALLTLDMVLRPEMYSSIPLLVSVLVVASSMNLLATITTRRDRTFHTISMSSSSS